MFPLASWDMADGSALPAVAGAIFSQGNSRGGVMLYAFLHELVDAMAVGDGRGAGA